MFYDFILSIVENNINSYYFTNVIQMVNCLCYMNSYKFILL